MNRKAKQVLIDGFFPQIGTDSLRELLRLCRTDNPALVQGTNCLWQEWSETSQLKTCAIGSVAVAEGNLDPDQIENRFAELCAGADSRIGEYAACRWFLNWHDETPREAMLSALASEIEAEIKRRTEGAA